MVILVSWLSSTSNFFEKKSENNFGGNVIFFTFASYLDLNETKY